MVYYLGIDLHKDTAFWTIKEPNGKIVCQTQLPVEQKVTIKTLQQWCNVAPIEAALEPVCAWQLYESWLRNAGVTVYVVQPLKVKAIAWNKLKNDRVDSEILADLVRLGFVPNISIPTADQSELSRLICFRLFLVRERAKLKQKMREILISQNIACRRIDVFGKKASREIADQSLPLNYATMRESIFQIGDTLTLELKKLRQYLETHYGILPDVKILCSIPGIGLITALSLRAVVGEWKRFSSPHCLASYAGLVPSAADSGSRIRRGHITKRGSRILRGALYEATLNVNPSWGHLWNFYQRIKGKKGSRCARVALARKMLTISWYLMKRNEYFVPQNTNRPDLALTLAPNFSEAVRIE